MFLSVSSFLVIFLSICLGMTEALSIDFRRQLITPNALATALAAPKAPEASKTPEARCDTHVYTTDYIRRTLDTVTNLGAQHITAGESQFPKPFGDGALMMIFPLLRNDEVYTGTEETPGPDRIVVSMIGKRRYFILTTVEQDEDLDDDEFVDIRSYQTCEYIPRPLEIS